MLKAQDVVILLKILASGKDASPQKTLAEQLRMSGSTVNAARKRLIVSRLLGQRENKALAPIKQACEEFLILGVKYFFPATDGEYTCGIVTSYSAPVFEKHILSGNDSVRVWPLLYAPYDLEQPPEIPLARGVLLEPLWHSVPHSITQYPDKPFYDLLALVDAIRSGKARERNIAEKLLRERIR